MVELKEQRLAGSVNHQITDAVEQYLSGQGESCMVPLIASVPCGPWAPIWESRRMVDIGESGSKLGINEDDFLVEADGLSMVADSVKRHIPNGAWVVLRWLAFTPGQICLCRADIDGEEPLWTLKRWGQDENGKPRLVDGHNNPVEWPANVVNVQAVAGFRGVITSHLDVSDKPLHDEIYQLQGQVSDMQEVEELSRVIEDRDFIDVAVQSGYAGDPAAFAKMLLTRVAEQGYEAVYRFIHGEGMPTLESVGASDCTEGQKKRYANSK
jgi:hypothetical protein